MTNKDEVTGTAPKAPKPPVDGKEKEAEKGGKPPKGKKKKKHQSAIVAAAQAASVVSEANARSTGDVGFGSTGTNLSYKEDGGVL